MTIGPLSVEYRGTRRVRTTFSGPLASGAFSSISLYTFTNLDGSAANPIHVVAVFAIATNPNAVEIAVDADFVSGALYEVGFASVPAQDGSFFTGVYDARVGLQTAGLPNQEPQASDATLLAYGRDLVYRNGFQQDASGDLLTQTGRNGWVGALMRRVTSLGLPWDPSYGPQAEQYVDAPAPLAVPLAGRLIAQAMADDRTASASVSLEPSDGQVGDFAFALSVTSKADNAPATITVPVSG